jgi:hypothetical protein
MVWETREKASERARGAVSDGRRVFQFMCMHHVCVSGEACVLLRASLGAALLSTPHSGQRFLPCSSRTRVRS